jgi:hypothetical protein
MLAKMPGISVTTPPSPAVSPFTLRTDARAVARRADSV